MKSSWSIVSTVKSTPEGINYFIEHHLNQGVSEIFIFLDSPQDFDFSTALLKHPRVYVFPCNDEFWENRSYFDVLPHAECGKPTAIEHRQYHNLLYAYELSNADWIAMIDIDEFIYSNDNIAQKLATYPANVFSLCMEPLEAIYQDSAPKNLLESYKTKFFKSRRIINNRYWNKFYSEELRHRSGFFGHTLGKTFLRTNCLLKQISCHITRPLDITYGVAIIEPNIHLLHCEAMAPDEFVQKNLNRIHNKVGTRYLDQVSKDRLEYLHKEYESKGIDRMYDIYNSMHVKSKDVIEQLKSDGYVFDVDEMPQFEFYIQTFHGTILVYSISEKKVLAVRKDDLENNSDYILVRCAYSQSASNLSQKIYFYISGYQHVNNYLYADRFGLLKAYHVTTAQLLKIVKISQNKFAVMLEGKYLTVTKTGDVAITAIKQNTWEVLTLVDKRDFV